MLRGAGRFADDFSVRGQVWARVVRSPVAHGLVRRVDTSEARSCPGVVGAVTAADLPAGLAIPVRLAVQDIDLSSFLQPVLAAEVVRYVGEPLAVVLAEDPYTAEDAAELVDLDIDETPPVLDALAAARPGAPQLFGAGNVAADFTLGFGDVDAAFDRAATVVEAEIEIGRHTAVPLEPRALLADVDPAAGTLSIYGMTKVPVFNRDVLAGLLGMPEDMIHVHAVDAGGGFGVRGEFYPEDFLVPWLATRLRRPVKWTEDRAEHLVAVNHSRQQRHRIAVAFDPAGKITGLRDDIVHDNGAYCRTHGIAVPELTVTMLPGPYRIPAYRGRIQVVLTNKTPCGTYRAPGRFEGTMAREQLLDVAASRLGLDRTELRRRNLLGPGEMPHTRAMTALGTEVILDAADYPALLAAAEAEAGRLGYHDEVARGRAGAGCAAWAWPCSWRRAGWARRRPRTSSSAEPGRSACSPAGPRSGRASRPRWRRSRPTPWASARMWSGWSTGTPPGCRSAWAPGPPGRPWSRATRCTPRRWPSATAPGRSPPGCWRWPRTT